MNMGKQTDESQGFLKYLQPWKEKKLIQGKLSYNESAQAWSLLRLHKALLDEFKELKEKRGIFGYEIVLFYSYEQLDRFIAEVKNAGKVPPLLLWIGKKIDSK